MGFKLFRLTRAVVCWAFISSASAAISESGKTVVVDGIRYHVTSDAVSVIGASADMLSRASTAGVDLIPLSIISDSSTSFTASILQSTVDYYTKSDDVFNTGFLQSIYLKHTGPSPAAIQYPLDSVLTQYGTKLFMVSREYQPSAQGLDQPIADLQKDIPSGPYFMSAKTGNVYRAYRLYSDTYQAFTEGLKESEDGIYSVLDTAVDRSQTSTIGVPSRLYSTKTDAQPLAGVRLGVKDIYDIAGVKTGGGSRAYYGLYPEKNVTAITVQRLIDAGAVIVGKMVTTQFARGGDWVDYPASWNVRGNRDGYQDPIGSSTGPAAGIAGYDWLDITLGTDTGGSIRGPASLYGAFGNRPSFGLVSLEGVIPLSTNFDTPGFITRDPVLWHSAARILYAENITSNFPSMPKKILTIEFPTKDNSTYTPEATTVILDFLSKLQNFLQADSPVAIDPPKLWEANPPAAANGTSLMDFIGLAYTVCTAVQQYNLLAVPFYADYSAANQGRRPYVEPGVTSAWDWGQKNVSSDGYNQSINNGTVFKQWWEEAVMKTSPESCSESLMLYVIQDGKPVYKPVYRSEPKFTPSVFVGRLVSWVGAPDLVFPIGQVPYNSTVTLKEEMLPIAVNFVAAKGCDGMIFTLAEQLLAAGILKIPKVGPQAF